ncbi:MAG TPA: folylpolyglutamate synthase/dihydrofolate synthase family protein [Candidatus Methylomirabilis sp.]|nr:folylpolyglutamate synthase/dihydrofolate synthase family protein [Candidatus Methylomirabilis sp.]
MTYPDALQYLYGLQRLGIKLGLENIRRLLQALGNPERAFRAVHVGGTNGKGSTAAMLAAVLQAAGLRVGLYTSPHLLDFSERIRVNGKPIGPPAVTSLTAEVRAAVEATFAHVPDELPSHPTFFEVTTALAFLHFARAGAEWAVVEVGLGGRYDATNVLAPDLTVITNVAVEHQDLLGESLEAIAAEKAGIVKPGIPLVTAATEPALTVLRRAAEERGAPLLHVPGAYSWLREAPLPDGQVFSLRGPRTDRGSLRISLLGRHQLVNAATAVAAAETLREGGLTLSEEGIREGLSAARWPARLQVVGERPRLLVDGAHNPAACRAVRDFLEEEAPGRRLLVFGALKDKDWGQMLKILLPAFAAAILCRPPSDRAADPASLVEAARGLCPHVEVVPEVRDALARARALARPEDAILVTGSLFTAGAALADLGR